MSWWQFILARNGHRHNNGTHGSVLCSILAIWTIFTMEMDCIYTALLSKALNNFTITHHWQWATMHGTGVTTGSNLEFSVPLKDTNMWTGGTKDWTDDKDDLLYLPSHVGIYKQVSDSHFKSIHPCLDRAVIWLFPLVWVRYKWKILQFYSVATCYTPWFNVQNNTTSVRGPF